MGDPHKATQRVTLDRDVVNLNRVDHICDDTIHGQGIYSSSTARLQSSTDHSIDAVRSLDAET